MYKKTLTFTLCKNSCKNKRNCKHAKKEFQLIYVQMLNQRDLNEIILCKDVYLKKRSSIYNRK